LIDPFPCNKQTSNLSREAASDCLRQSVQERACRFAQRDFTYSGRSTFHSPIVGQDFAARGSSIFLTGATYSDSITDDDYYTVGEALAGVDIVATRQNESATSHGIVRQTIESLV